MPRFAARIYTRREMLALSGQAALAGALAPSSGRAAEQRSSSAFGAIVGDPVAVKVGERILRDGGNAIDAAIATAFAVGIVSPSKCGVGGYGGHAMIALAGGKKIAAIDFDSMAPAAARADMFPLDANGQVKGNVNIHGWLAAGVPGTVAGLELALSRFGTRSLRDTLAPAIQMCEEGVYVVPVKGLDDASRNDPRPDSAQPGARQKQRNLALARLLKTLAQRNSADSFYRGDIADTIAAAFQKNGGLVTKEDLAAYRARELAPLDVAWNGMSIHTAPLPATGLLMLEAAAILKALGWQKFSAPERKHARLEALRIAWADRTRTFGDPDFVSVPVAELTSAEYAAAMAKKVAVAVQTKKPVPLVVDPSHAGGTTHISAVDRSGNMIAITLTHGGGFGARVAVEELGIVLGHGMSRFDPRPGRANSPGPRKRPLTNMCPSIVTRDGVGVLAVGAAGGTRIPNSVGEVLFNFVGLGATMETAMAAPRLDTNGTLEIGLDKRHPVQDEEFFRGLGYSVVRRASANVGAVSWDPATGHTQGIGAGV
jgi:gamma-glutamyltranspeptidase/glutathione hydrolase